MDVLILEDEWLIAEELKERVEALGYQTLGPVYTCAAALALLRSSRPGAAILDTQVGDETCQLVLEECDRLGVPVVISSGHAEAALPPFAADCAYVSKPFAPEALSRALAAVLGQPRG